MAEIKVPIVLTREEQRKLPPQERELYIREILRQTLEMNLHEEKKDKIHGDEYERADDHPLEKSDSVIDQFLQHTNGNQVRRTSDRSADSSNRGCVGECQQQDYTE